MKLVSISMLAGVACLSLFINGHVAVSGTHAVTLTNTSQALGGAVSIQMRGATMDDILAKLAAEHTSNIMRDGKPGRERSDVSFSGTLQETLDFLGKSFSYQ